ncbi:hypothetical protein KCU88_g272, partial [Aureobasidium melanogenum]
MQVTRMDTYLRKLSSSSTSETPSQLIFSLQKSGESLLDVADLRLYRTFALPWRAMGVDMELKFDIEILLLGLYCRGCTVHSICFVGIRFVTTVAFRFQYPAFGTCEHTLIKHHAFVELLPIQGHHLRTLTPVESRIAEDVRRDGRFWLFEVLKARLRSLVKNAVSLIDSQTERKVIGCRSDLRQRHQQCQEHRNSDWSKKFWPSWKPRMFPRCTVVIPHQVPLMKVDRKILRYAPTRTLNRSYATDRRRLESKEYPAEWPSCMGCEGKLCSMTWHQPAGPTTLTLPGKLGWCPFPLTDTASNKSKAAAVDACLIAVQHQQDRTGITGTPPVTSDSYLTSRGRNVQLELDHNTMRVMMGKRDTLCRYDNAKLPGPVVSTIPSAPGTQLDSFVGKDVNPEGIDSRALIYNIL